MMHWLRVHAQWYPCISCTLQAGRGFVDQRRCISWLQQRTVVRSLVSHRAYAQGPCRGFISHLQTGGLTARLHPAGPDATGPKANFRTLSATRDGR